MDIEEIKEEADEIVEEETVESEDASEETDTEGDETFDIDEEFEYDEDGNIVIPDEEEKGDTAEEQGESEEDEESAVGIESDAADAEAEEVAEPADKNDNKDEENARLRRELNALRSQIKDTLRLLNVESDDEMAGLVKLAAEAAETTTEEYLKKREKERLAEETQRTVQRLAFEKKLKEDLAAVHAAYPETRKYTSVLEFPNFKRFAELRDNGNTPTEAYDAAHPHAIRESAASATRQQSLNDTKKHLKSAVPKGSKDNSVTMSKKELAECREMFPDLSDKEILALYRKTAT